MNLTKSGLSFDKICLNEFSTSSSSFSPCAVDDIMHIINHSQCRLLTTFAKSLDPDQDGQNVRPDLDPNRSTL